MHGLQPWQKLEVYIVLLLGSDGEIFFFLQVEQKQEQALEYVVECVCGKV